MSFDPIFCPFFAKRHSLGGGVRLSSHVSGSSLIVASLLLSISSMSFQESVRKFFLLMQGTTRHIFRYALLICFQVEFFSDKLGL